jgi:signal transduction histidine kinase
VNTSAMTIHPAEGSTRVTARPSLARWNLRLEGASPPIRYGFAVGCVAVALGAALACGRYGFRDAEAPLFDLAIVVATWNAGVGPSVVAVVLSAACFDYFFTEPFYSFEVSREDLPRFLVFIAFAAITAWFADTLGRAASDSSLSTRSQSTLPEQARAGRHEWLPFLPIATAVFTGAIFVADTVTPVDLQFATLYTVVILMAARCCSPPDILRVAAGCVALTILSYYLTPPGLAGPEFEGIVNTAISLAAIGLVTLLALQQKTAETSVREQASEIGKLNRELTKQARELETSNNELESFAYSVSHDLRAPLRHVDAYSELLQKLAYSSLDEKGRRYIKTILESSKRMGNLIDDLLAFSRIGRAEAKMTMVSLDQLVKEVVAEIGQDTAERNIEWKISPLPVCYGDRSMLRLVIVNLLSNAVKFTRMRAKAEIEVGCVDGEDAVELFVKDDGAGFDMQYVDKLFGVFQRLHLPEQFEGTGIGLATVRRIVHRHGGEVRAEGVVDQGATFYVSLPKGKLAAERTANTP